MDGIPALSFFLMAISPAPRVFFIDRFKALDDKPGRLTGRFVSDRFLRRNFPY